MMEAAILCPSNSPVFSAARLPSSPSSSVLFKTSINLRSNHLRCRPSLHVKMSDGNGSKGIMPQKALQQSARLTVNCQHPNHEAIVMKTKEGDVSKTSASNLGKDMSDAALQILENGMMGVEYAVSSGLTTTVMLAIHPLLLPTVKIGLPIIRPIVAACYDITKIKKILYPIGAFENIVGQEEAKKELLHEIKIFQKDSKYVEMKVTLHKGILVQGPKGVGKTYFIHAVAAEAKTEAANVKLFEVSASALATNPSLIRILFNRARGSAPSIILIQDIENISRDHAKRSNCEDNPAVKELLEQMDKLNEDKDALVMAMATTSKPDEVDKALTGANRFFVKIKLHEPNEDDREKIFALQMEGISMEEKETIYKAVASQTEGFSRALLERVAGMSKRIAAREGHTCVRKDDALEAVEQVKKFDSNGTKPPYSVDQTAQEGK